MRPLWIPLLILLVTACDDDIQVDDPWASDKFVDQKELIVDPSRHDLNAKLLEPDFQSNQDDYSLDSFFETYPSNPGLPPEIDARQKAFDPNRRSPPVYGTKEFLPTVPMTGTKPFPKDYAGVDRWNRKMSLNGDKNPPRGGYGSSSDSVNPPPSAFYFDVGDSMSLSEAITTKDPDLNQVSLGFLGSFALNLVDTLRGGSLSGGPHLLYVYNRYFYLDSWLGYRRVTAGITGEDREVLTLHNLALGVGVGALPYAVPGQHFRIGLDLEYDFNLLTQRELAGGATESFSSVHFFALGMGAAWFDGAWGVFTKYHLSFQQISEDHNGLLHIFELGLMVYLF